MNEHRLRPAPDGVVSCVFCGCTEEQACPGGCAWASNEETDGRQRWGPICTSCVEIAENLDRFLTMIPQRDRRRRRTGFDVLRWLAYENSGPRLLLDRWAIRQGVVVPVYEPPKEGRRKTPRPAIPVSTRKQGLKVSHAAPRRKGNPSRQPGGRRG